jgi:prepilin-type N-terminal cleavage/methylation domain-containing protein
MRNRRGFSMTEVLVVLVLIALIMKMSFPKIIAIRERNAVRAAKLQLVSQITTARAAAIRRSQPSTFTWQSGEALAKVGPTGTENVVSGRVRLAAMQVTVTPTDDIQFDPRGFATNLTARKVYRFTRNNYTDSLCVSKLGQISRYCQ